MGQLRRRRRREPGGIVALRELTKQHRSALEYDWRTRFGLPFSKVGTKAMTWGEALRLLDILRADPSSMLAAAMEGWAYPLPREVSVLMDLYDLQYAKTGAKNRKPYPRPFKVDENTRRRGNVAGRSQAEVRAILARAGHGIQPPV